MTDQHTSIGLLSDFNARNFAVLLQKHSGPLRARCTEAPFGQTTALLLNHEANFWKESYDALVVWSLPDRAVGLFQRALNFETFSVEELLAEVDAYAVLIQRIPATVRTIFVPLWVTQAAEHEREIASTLTRMNLRLMEHFQNDRRVVVFHTQQWIGTAAYSPKLWYMAKTPFDTTVFQAAAEDMLAALNGIMGGSKKVVILDLDNTLWGGIVGDIGWAKLRLGGHDPIGEAFVDFQRKLKRLTRRGIVLAIASKNDEARALEAIRRHPEMALAMDDFAAWRINWDDKAANIAELMSELNLGLDSAVFLDDSAFERARVREALPQVLVPELPADPMEYGSWFSRLRCFDKPHVTAEDRARSPMYVADRQRKLLQTEVKSLSDWLEKLDLTVQREVLNDESLERAAQLFNKTNQMNLSTRRLTASELISWAAREEHALWTFRVSDKFGDYGLCGIASLVRSGTRGQMLDFLLSCRVMGRGVEEAMLATVVGHAQALGCAELRAEYLPTDRNQPCATWLEKQPGLRRESNVFILGLPASLEAPRHIRITEGTFRETIPA